MSIYRQFETDRDAETTVGVDLDYGDGCKIRVLRASNSNKRYAKLLGDRLKPYRRQIDTGTFSEDVAESVLREVYADSIIVGWSGVKDRDGRDIPYSRDNVIRVLTDLPELFRDIQDQSGRVSNFKSEDIKDDLGN